MIPVIVGSVWVAAAALTLILCLLLGMVVAFRLQQPSNFDVFVLDLLVLRTLFALSVGIIDALVNAFAVIEDVYLCKALQVVWISMQATEIFLIVVLLIGEIIQLAKYTAYKGKTRSVCYHTGLVLFGGIAIGLVPLYMQADDADGSCDIIMKGVTQLPMLLLLILYSIALPLSLFALCTLVFQSNRHISVFLSRQMPSSNGHVTNGEPFPGRRQIPTSSMEENVKSKRDTAILIYMVSTFCNIIPFAFVHGLLTPGLWSRLYGHWTLIGCGLLEGLLLPLGLLVMSATYRQAIRRALCSTQPQLYYGYGDVSTSSGFGSVPRNGRNMYIPEVTLTDADCDSSNRPVSYVSFRAGGANRDSVSNGINCSYWVSPEDMDTRLQLVESCEIQNEAKSRTAPIPAGIPVPPPLPPIGGTRKSVQGDDKNIGGKNSSGKYTQSPISLSSGKTKDVMRSQSSASRLEWKKQMMEKHFRGGTASFTLSKRANNEDQQTHSSILFKSDEPDAKYNYTQCGNWSLRAKPDLPPSYAESTQGALYKGSVGRSLKLQEVPLARQGKRRSPLVKMDTLETPEGADNVSVSSQGSGIHYGDSDIDIVLEEDANESVRGKSKDSPETTIAKNGTVVTTEGFLTTGDAVALNKVAVGSNDNVSRKKSFLQQNSSLTRNTVKRHTSMLMEKDLRKVKRTTSISGLYGALKRKLSKVSLSRKESTSRQDGGFLKTYTNPFLYDMEQANAEVYLNPGNPFYYPPESPLNYQPYGNLQDSFYFGDIQNGVSSSAYPFHTHESTYPVDVTNPFHESFDSVTEEDVTVNPGIFLDPTMDYGYDVVEEQTKTVKPNGEIIYTTRIRRKRRNPFLGDLSPSPSMTSEGAGPSSYGVTNPFSSYYQTGSRSPHGLRRQWKKVSRALSVVDVLGAKPAERTGGSTSFRGDRNYGQRPSSPRTQPGNVQRSDPVYTMGHM